MGPKYKTLEAAVAAEAARDIHNPVIVHYKVTKGMAKLQTEQLAMVGKTIKPLLERHGLVGRKVTAKSPLRLTALWGSKRVTLVHTCMRFMYSKHQKGSGATLFAKMLDAARRHNYVAVDMVGAQMDME